MLNVKSRFNSHMIKKVKVVITTTLVLVVTINLVTNQVLAISLENKQNVGTFNYSNELSIVPEEKLTLDINTKINSRTELLLNSILERKILLDNLYKKYLEVKPSTILSDTNDFFTTIYQNTNKKLDKLTLDIINSNELETSGKTLVDLKIMRVVLPQLQYELQLQKNIQKLTLLQEELDWINKSTITEQSIKKKLNIQLLTVVSQIESAKNNIKSLNENRSEVERTKLISNINIYLKNTEKVLNTMNIVVDSFKG
jgi:hypothetical protein